MGLGHAGREASAERLVATVTASATVDEAVGAVRIWRECGTVAAREVLMERNNPGGLGAEATRVAGVIGDEAHGRADPDWG